MVGDPARRFDDWIGRASRSEDVVTERLVASFRATFSPNLAPVPDNTAPLGIHWCLSPIIAPMSELGADAHPAKNRDLPPVPLPRRMWAGGSLQNIDDLRVGDHVIRTSVIADIRQKLGRSGKLWFVSVDHEYATSRGPAIRERHEIVYREAASPSTKPPASIEDEPGKRPAPRTSWTVETTATLLFRYSALTFNGHRIHYDLPYAVEVEGYPGLVVHGPLQATLLLNLAATGKRGRPARFDYRGTAPAIAGVPLEVCADTDSGRLWTQDPSGAVKMEARVSAS
jgi:3-methylfumaryl-CoA hydratase